MRRQQLTVQRVVRAVFVLPRFETPERKQGAATMRDEPRPYSVLAVDRLPSGSGVPPMRRTLQRRLPAARFLLLGPVLVHGVRAVHLSRKSERHRSLSAELAGQAVSHGHPRAGL